MAVPWAVVEASTTVNAVLPEGHLATSPLFAGGGVAGVVGVVGVVEPDEVTVEAADFLCRWWPVGAEATS